MEVNKLPDLKLDRITHNTSQTAFDYIFDSIDDLTVDKTNTVRVFYEILSTMNKMKLLNLKKVELIEKNGIIRVNLNTIKSASSEELAKKLTYSERDLAMFMLLDLFHFEDDDLYVAVQYLNTLVTYTEKQKHSYRIASKK